MFRVKATEEQCEALRSMCDWLKYGAEDLMANFEENAHISLPEDCFYMLFSQHYSPAARAYYNIHHCGPFEVLGRWFYLEDE